MRRLLIIFISSFLILTTKSYSNITNQIIYKLEKTNNYNFEFKQKIDNKKETGECFLVFDRKINCKYDNSGKILISDGTNLIIKNSNSDNPNFYKLEDTFFYKILDKNFLIKELKNKNVEKENDKLFLNINYQDIVIKVFFDNKELYLKGWKTTDIYNNFVHTDIKILQINEIVEDDLFNINNYN